MDEIVATQIDKPLLGGKRNTNHPPSGSCRILGGFSSSAAVAALLPGPPPPAHGHRCRHRRRGALGGGGGQDHRLLSSQGRIRIRRPPRWRFPLSSPRILTRSSIRRRCASQRVGDLAFYCAEEVGVEHLLPSSSLFFLGSHGWRKPSIPSSAASLDECLAFLGRRGGRRRLPLSVFKGRGGDGGGGHGERSSLRLCVVLL